MPDGLRVTMIGGEAVKATLRKQSNALAGKGPLARRAWKRVGALALSAVEDDFTDLSKGRSVRGMRWRKVSFVTALLRRSGRGAKMTTEKDVERRRGELPILVDAGLLRNSFSARHKGNVFEIGSNSVEVGTADPRASRLAHSSRTTFKYTPEVEKRLEQNVRQILPGAKPRRTRTGRKSRAKKNWNRFFFVQRAILKKMARVGKGYKVPGRPMILRQPASRLQRWIDVWMRTVFEDVDR